MHISKYARSFIIAVSVVILVLSCNSLRTEGLDPGPVETLNQPNIIWIVGENLNLDLGIYGE